MALRILTCASLPYQELARNEKPRDRTGRCRRLLYNGAAPWTAAVEVRDLIGPVGPRLAPYQPSSRYFVP